MRHQLYRHYDKDGQLLYVGRSISALGRLLNHERSVWADENYRLRKKERQKDTKK